MLLSALVATLALAGAPASTPVLCNPDLPPSRELGVAYSDVVYVDPSGKVTPGNLNHVALGPLACGALLYASAAPLERARIRALNRGVNFDELLGVGLQVALHEATHVALNSPEECVVEKTTRGKVNSLIERYADPGRATDAEAAATRSDAQLPPAYHGC